MSLKNQLRRSLAREEGKAAFAEGKPVTANPYKYTEEEAAHDEWFFGYQSARIDNAFK